MDAARVRVPNHADRPDATLRMRSGRVPNLYDPSPLDISPIDYVYGLSRLARWGGQTKGELKFNVLQHCVLAHDLLRDAILPSRAWKRSGLSQRLALQAALFHDLHEGGGLGDIITPYSRLLNLGGGLLEEVKDRLDRCLAVQMGISWPLPEAVRKAVKLADRAAAVSEAVQLMGYSEAEARAKIGRGYAGKLYAIEIVPLDEAASRALWLQAAARAGLRIEAARGAAIDQIGSG